jgi:RNA polymerase sigma-70 factor (ECF subfamily)
VREGPARPPGTGRPGPGPIDAGPIAPFDRAGAPGPGALADPDSDLVAACRAGHGAAFDVLVRRHEARAVRLAARMLGDADAALDAAQEAFVKAWRALPRFEGESRFSTWLVRIVINQCRNDLRQRKTVKHTRPMSLDAPLSSSDGSPGVLADAVAAAGPDPFDLARGREVAGAIESALRRLDPDSREVLWLRDAEDLSYEDIAEVLDVPVGTVRSRLHRARADVRRHLSGVLE